MSTPEYKTEQQLKVMSDHELADYLEVADWDYDWLSQAGRVALVRLLRREANKED